MRSMSIPWRQFLTALLAFVFLALASIRTANATGGCPATPENWAGSDCTIDSRTVCGFTGTVAWCDVNWSTDDAVVIMVSSYDFANYAVQAWGEANGELFCCPLAAQAGSPTVTSVEIVGSDEADELRFTWTDGASTYSQYVAPNDYIWAGNRADILVGSLSGNTSDHLYGEDHPDTINALDGRDFLYGGDGPDTMSGGPGIDDMFGEAGSDTMTGNEGDDYMEGGTDKDYMNGYAGDDILDGGAGPDVMCGGGETAGGTDDYLTDGDAVSEGVGGDILWGSQMYDADECNAANTSWDGFATTSTCSGNPVYVPPGGIMTLPPDCP